MNVDVVQNAGKNLTIRLTGYVEADGLETIDLAEITKGHNNSIPEKLKLSSALWLIQEKLGINLYWGEPGAGSFVFPMESRNSVRFDVGIVSPKDWNKKLSFVFFGFSRDPVPTKFYSIIIDFDR